MKMYNTTVKMPDGSTATFDGEKPSMTEALRAWTKICEELETRGSPIPEFIVISEE